MTDSIAIGSIVKIVNPWCTYDVYYEKALELKADMEMWSSGAVPTAGAQGILLGVVDYYHLVRIGSAQYVMGLRGIKKVNPECQFEGLKPITGENLYKAHACRAELEVFMHKYGLYTEVPVDQEFIEYATEQNGWLKFLIQEKFIQKKKPVKTYKIGDCFNIGARDVYMIARVGTRQCRLIKLPIRGNNSHLYFDRTATVIEDVNRITELELEDMSGICYDSLKQIPASSVFTNSLRE